MPRGKYEYYCDDCRHSVDDHGGYGCDYGDCECNTPLEDVFPSPQAYQRYRAFRDSDEGSEPYDLDDAGDGSRSKERNEGCFIATAAFGSSLDPRLDALRKWRDDSLMPRGFGRVLVATYYRVSPPFARMVAQSNKLRWIVRACLRRLLQRIERGRAKS